MKIKNLDFTLDELFEDKDLFSSYFVDKKLFSYWYEKKLLLKSSCYKFFRFFYDKLFQFFSREYDELREVKV